MPEKTNWWLRAATATTLVALTLGTGTQFAYAFEAPSAVQSDSALGDADWAEIAKLFGAAEERVKDPGLFSLWKVAKLKKISFQAMLDKIKFRGQFTPVQLEGMVTKAGYTADDTPAAGAIAIWGANTEVKTDSFTLPVGEDGFAGYVSRVDEETLLVEAYGFGADGGYGTARVKASNVSRFLHLGQDPAPKVKVPGKPAPSSPGTVAELPERELKDDYPAERLAAEHPTTKIDATIRQCGYYALWRVLRASGMTMADFTAKRTFLATTMGSKEQGGSAGEMDDLFASLGVTVDDKPAVGAIATWESRSKVQIGTSSFTMAEAGHAAYVSRVYQFNAEDEAEATAMVGDAAPDYTAINEMLARAGKSGGEKVTFVLLEDYNSFGGEHKYGVKLLPANKIEHYIHLANTPLTVKITPAETVQRILAEHPEYVRAFGNPVGEPKVETNQVTQELERGKLVYFGAGYQYVAMPPGGSFEAPEVKPTLAEAFSQKWKKIQEKINRAVTLLAEREPDPETRKRLEKALAEYRRLQVNDPAADRSTGGEQ